jgi:hypothetical protein
VFEIQVKQALRAIDPLKINYIGNKEKFRDIKILTCNGTLRQVFYCLRPRTLPPPPYTLYTRKQYTYSHRKGGRAEPERRFEGLQFKKLGRKYQHD